MVHQALTHGTEYLRKILVMITAMCFLTLGVAGPVQAAPDDSGIDLANGICDLPTSDPSNKGTATNPYLVDSPKKLAEINDCNNGTTFRYYVQTADIDLTPTTDGSQAQWNDSTTGGWNPIGDTSDTSSIFDTKVFRGNYNGQNHAITNLTMYRTNSENSSGLFGYLSKANISNLVVGSETPSLAGSIYIAGGGGIYVGAVAGATELSNFKNVHVINTVLTSENVTGGLVGEAYYGSFTNVSSSAVISPSNRAISGVGGIVGDLEYAHITQATFTGSIISDYNDAGTWSYNDSVGGICGYCINGSVTDASVSADIYASYYVGGVGGYLNKAIFKDVSYTGTIFASHGVGNDVNADYVGGVAGYSDASTVLRSESSGAISATTDLLKNAHYVGGIVGGADGLTIDDAQSSMDISVIGEGGENDETSYIGGIVGYPNNAGINNARYSGALVTTDAYNVAGIAGATDGGLAITNSTFSGSVTNNLTSDQFFGSPTAGILGYGINGVLISKCSTTAGSSVSSTPDSFAASRVGGIAGQLAGGAEISDSFNRASVTGYGAIGGIVGDARHFDLLITHTYTTGLVTGSVGAGPIDPFATGAAFKEQLDRTNTFDTTATGALTSDTGVVGSTTAQMKTKSTFEALGFDFSSANPVWGISASVNDGYPYLLSESSSTTSNEQSSASPLRDVYGPTKFSQYGTKLSKRHKSHLAAYAAAIKAGSYTKVTIKSYTRKGDMRRATMRAKIIGKYLKKKGVKIPIRIEAVKRDSKKLNNKVILVATGK